MKTLTVLLALTTIPMGAMAQQTTYSYIGAPMKGTLSPGTSPGPYDDTQLIGTIVLSAPLKPYQSSQIVVPITYSFNNNPALSNTRRDNPIFQGTYSGQLFSFDTDVDGNIIGWTVVIASTTFPTLAINENVGMTSVANNAGGSYDGYRYEDVTTSCFVTQACTVFSAFTLTQGSWSLGPLPQFPPNLGVLYCLQGQNIYRVIKPSNTASSNVSPNLSGNPSLCAPPSTEPSTWYIKTTLDGGGTWKWVLLSSLGFGN